MKACLSKQPKTQAVQLTGSFNRRRLFPEEGWCNFSGGLEDSLKGARALALPACWLSLNFFTSCKWGSWFLFEENSTLWGWCSVCGFQTITDIHETRNISQAWNEKQDAVPVERLVGEHLQYEDRRNVPFASHDGKEASPRNGTPEKNAQTLECGQHLLLNRMQLWKNLRNRSYFGRKQKKLNEHIHKCKTQLPKQNKLTSRLPDKKVLYGLTTLRTSPTKDHAVRLHRMENKMQNVAKPHARRTLHRNQMNSPAKKLRKRVHQLNLTGLLTEPKTPDSRPAPNHSPVFLQCCYKYLEEFVLQDIHVALIWFSVKLDTLFDSVKNEIGWSTIVWHLSQGETKRVPFLNQPRQDIWRPQLRAVSGCEWLRMSCPRHQVEFSRDFRQLSGTGFALHREFFPPGLSVVHFKTFEVFILEQK